MQRRRVSEELRNIAPREGTEIIYLTFLNQIFDRLRNIAPREGTEICKTELLILILFILIKKYSSPRGDGNKAELFSEL